MPNYREEDEENTIEAEAVREPADPVEQDIRQRQIVSGGSAAPGGGIVPPPARSAGAVLDMLEDGQLSADVHHELQEVAAAIRAVANTTRGKAKGSVTLTLSLEGESDGAIRVQAKVAAKAPDLPRKLSIMWQDGDSFTRFPPGQSQMFGSAPIRRVG